MIVCNFVLLKGHLTGKTARQGILNFRVDGRVTRKPTPFVPSCLRDTFVRFFHYPYCVSYLGNFTRS